MAASRPSSRYATMEPPFSSSSSHGPSVSSFHNTSKRLSSLKNLPSNSSGRRNPTDPVAVTATKDSSTLALAKNNPRTFSTMVKRLMENRSNSKAGVARRMELVIPADVVSEGLKRTVAKGSGGGFSSLHRKLFGRKELADRTPAKTLQEVNSNTRSLGMVLRSERELLVQNKELNEEISALRLLLEDKNMVVERLTDLCLRQREEIKALKEAILFPDAINPKIQDLFERQSCELEEAKKIIPSLQKQVSSLTGQIQCLAVDLAEVKADNYNYVAKNCFSGHLCSPRTPISDKASLKGLGPNSEDPLELDDDINPCLTPCFSKKTSKGYARVGYGSSGGSESFGGCNGLSPDVFSDSCDGMLLSRSSERCHKEGLAGPSTSGKTTELDEGKWRYGNQRSEYCL